MPGRRKGDDSGRQVWVFESGGAAREGDYILNVALPTIVKNKKYKEKKTLVSHHCG